MARTKRKRLVGALDGTGHGVVVTQDIPPVRRGQVLVRVYASLISPGTELRTAKEARLQGRTDPGRPRPFGYQNSGRVVAVAPGVKQFRKGDRVACMGGGYALHTDYAVVPQNLCARLPDNVSFEEGAYGHLAMTSLQAIRRGRPQIGEYLLVVGLGIVGQLAAQLGKLSGMYVMGWDMLKGRNRIAEKWGIDATVELGKADGQACAEQFTHGQGFDMAVMAFGGEATEALGRVLEVMKVTPDTHPMGRIVLVGGLTTKIGWPTALGNIDLIASSRTGPGYHDDGWEHGRRDYPAVFMRWTTRTNMELVLRLMSEGRLKVKPLTTHRLRLEEIDKAVTAHIESPGRTLGTVLLTE